MNEELRSTTEELETSREELRSMNEELHTVNQELNNKNEALARVNSDLHNLLRSTEIATVFLDRNLRVQRFTPRAEDLFNIIESDRGRPLAHVTQRFDHDGLLDDVRRVLDRLTPVEREVQNEEGRYFLAQIHPYRTAREDKIDGVVLSFVDITERREVEKELRRSEERHRLLLKGVEEYAIIMLDPEGRVATWNAGAEAIFGYTGDEIVGSTGAILYTEKDREAGLFEKKLEEARAEAQAAHDHWLTRRNGSRFWGTGVITALHDPGGSLRGFAKVMRDNTARRERVQELRRREERFRTLSEAMPDVAWETDADGQFTYINQRLTEFTGRPAEVFYGNTADPLFHPEEREAVLDAWQEALDTGETFQIEHRIQREDGAYRWFLTRALPVRDEETGRITRWLGTSTEIHERKEAQGELRRLNETLEERVEERTAQVRRLVSQLVQAEERERRRIAQVLHDDVQQQIYGAEMTARRARRLLESGDLGEEAAEQFTDVCNQMDAILEEAIETTRTLSAELSPSVLREEDLGDILRWLAEHMQQRHGLTVETDVSEASAVPDDDLRALLFRVVRELLFNIVKHANVDHAHLDARTEDGELLVQIRDDGAGFDPETLAGDGPSGYGLSEMRERLRLLGGRLDIKSAPGEGTRAIVAVPAPGGVGA